MIDVHDLSHRFRGGAGFGPLDLVIPSGTSCAIIGPSGCGKTTLLHVLCGLVEATAGRYRVGSDDGATGGVGLVQQRDALFPWLRVRENITLSVPRSERRSARVRERVDTLAAALGIASILDAWPGTLSGGERQRVSIARTLLGEPSELLLDEPSSALDAFSREALQDLLLDLHARYRHTALYVTHSIEEALFLASEVVVMGRDGRIAATVANPLYPDPTARREREFYDLAIRLRTVLEEASRGSQG